MNNKTDAEFKSLITKEEYERLIEKFAGSKSDYQTNHYFDTTRFSLKALDASIRVREREDFSLTYKRKKGYNIDVRTIIIDKEKFNEIKETGVIDIPEISEELQKLIKEQKLVNFLSLSTFRTYLPYGNGILNIDKSEYLDKVDYEIEYTAKSYHQGKEEFIKLISELKISYKKSDKKIKRAYTRLKELM